MDCAAVTGGIVQDASSGVGEYGYEHCGICKHVCVEGRQDCIQFGNE